MHEPNQDKRLMTAEEVFCYCVNRYPGLYAMLDEQSTRMLVYDQLFNVLGNGYRNMADLKHAFTWTPKMAKMTQGIPAKYMGPDPLFEGFTALSQDKHAEPGTPDFNSRVHGYFTEEEKADHPDVKVWQPREKGRGSWFYPNFKKEHSLLYCVNLDLLDRSWLEAGMFYYTHAKTYFASPDVEHYADAWPNDLEEQARKTSDIDDGMDDLNDDEKALRWVTLSKNYGVSYTGDTAVFLQTYWTQENQRIQAFIDATLIMLEQHLNTRQTAGV